MHGSITPDIAFPDPGTVRRKIEKRILPFLFAAYVVAYIDRANVAFAKVQMSADLGFSEAAFGFGAGVFFAGYFLLEIPGAVIVERWSARLWLARILITWGVCTVAVGFVSTPAQFYIARFCLGAAEAGFFPGIIVYLSHWFRAEDRGRALSGFVLAVPVSFVISAPVSALCLMIHWGGIPGWRWTFILQGIPAVLLGIAAPFWLSERPASASWLTPDEREWLTNELGREAQRKRDLDRVSVLEGLRHPVVLILACALFLIVLGSYGIIFWLPSRIATTTGASASFAAVLSGLPFLFACIGVWYAGRSSDRARERKVHVVIPLFCTAVLFALSMLPGQAFAITLGWISLTALMLWAWAPPFWTIPTAVLGGDAAAVSIGLINSIGNLGGFIGPWVIGALLSSGYGYSTAAAIVCGCFVVAAGLIATLPVAAESF